MQILSSIVTVRFLLSMRWTSLYFEFVNGRFELVNSPDQAETDRLLAELSKYHEEIKNAYKQTEADSDNDFERLGQLLKENLYSWWD